MAKSSKRAAEDHLGAVFHVRLLSGESFALHASKRLEELAMKWSYMVGQRDRWRGSRSRLRDLYTEAADDLGTLPVQGRSGGLKAAEMERIAQAAVVEIDAPSSRTDGGWALRVFPWESVIALPAMHRSAPPPVVVRSMGYAGGSRDPSVKPESVMFVESEPGGLRGMFSFESELDLVQANVPVDEGRFHHVFDASLVDIEEGVRAWRPDVVHMAGIDAHEGARLLRLGFDRRRHDGYYCEGAGDAAHVAEASALAAALTPGSSSRAPRLLSCGFYNSGRRICAEAVAYGVGAAIGITEQIEDQQAELFYASFYRALQHTEYELLPAFRLAVQNTMEASGSKGGAGFTLWSRRSLLEALGDDGAGWQASEQGRMKRARADIRAKREAEVIQRQSGPSGASDGTAVGAGSGSGSTGTGSGQSLVHAHAQPHKHINYGRLHNGRSLFQSFTLQRTGLAHATNVQVEVALYVGATAFEFRGTFDLKKPSASIADKIHVPLTWEYMRSLRESVRTTVYAHVTHYGQTVLQQTWPVNLLPVNEWLDTEEENVFLPSFVLPSDPAVSRIVDCAQKYLGAYGDPSAGFDGYQSVALRKDGSEDLSGVDHQVGALWHALMQDFDLKYVNPPPTYTDASQRLRTPSRILQEGRGTCIDLALLFAACLEYVEIHPVLFLMTGHAFTGFWRSERAYDEFHDPVTSFQRLESPTQEEIGRVRGRLTAEWVVGPESYREVMRRVWEEELVPLETVLLTDRKAMWDAWDAGIENLESPEEFDVMLQVWHARRASTGGVTPIPYEGNVG